jgi:VWFA-related protein
MSLRFAGPAVLTMIFAAAISVGAQAPAAPPPVAGDAQVGAGEASPLQVQSQLVLVPTTVETGKGDVIYELKASQFVVEDNGVPQRVRLDESDEVRPLSMVVAVQCSRAAEMEFAKMQGLITMIDAITGDAPAEVAVEQFGTGEELLTGFTRDTTVRNEALHKIAPCDYDAGDNIFDAVDYANTLLDAHHANGRRVVLLISETRERGSQAKAEDVIRELGRSNTVVDAVAFGPGKSEMVDDLKHGGGGGLLSLLVMAVEAMRTNAPKEFSRLTGGEYINFTTQKGFDQGMNLLANHVHNFYMLSFQPRFPVDALGSGVAAPGLHKIVVKIPEYPSAIVRHRETYWANGPAGEAATPAK